MTRQEFITRAKRKTRIDALSFGSPLILIMLLTLTYVPCIDRAEALIAAHVSDVLAPPIAMLPVFLPVAGFLALVVPMFKSVERTHGVPCPHCDRQLDAPVYRGVVVATGNCPLCGERVLSEPDDPTTPEAPATPARC
ncbi:MAG: hypothetical protein ACYTGP_01295 [Planctomycetota bacterium]|jgi:endogenous inhibitor of DNA gyrase (YacG/DUF329 family)